MRRAVWMMAMSMVPVCGCLSGSFDALSDAAPVQTIAVPFPTDASAEIAIALTVAADDEGRGRVLFSDAAAALGWMRVDLDGRAELRFAHFTDLADLGGSSEPTLTGLAVVPDVGVAEGLVRIAASDAGPDRVVRFRVADFSRIESAELDMHVYPWVAGSGSAPSLSGPLAVVQLDDGLPEALSASSAGVFVWDALGTRLDGYVEAGAGDPDAFVDDPRQGYGLTHCELLTPTAIAGGRVLAGGERAAVLASGETLTFVAVADPPQHSLVGAPIYDCARATLELPGAASSLAVVDLGRDGDDDLLVGSTSEAAVWVYENLGDGVPATPTLVLAGAGDESEFGASLTTVELGGEAPDVIVVGAPGTSVDDRVAVGRVLVYDAQTGELLRTIEDLEPQTNSRHGLGVHGIDVPGREELVVSGATELRVHWTILADDEGRVRP